MQAPTESTPSFNPARQPGPRVVRLFGSALALLWVAAWWSWGIQAQALVGRHGLLPLAEFFARAHGGAGPTPLTAPSVFWLVPQDWAILAAVGVGIVCATLAVFDVAPKGALTISALLYISFMAPAAPFLPVLADRLLLESTGLFLLLDRNRPGPAMHWLARGLLFKLYAEMGLGHWLAPGGVWLQGLALGDFLQTTPLPTPLGFYLAHLPEGLLNLATRAGVLVELLVPWLIFGPRRARLLAAVCLTLLQVGVALMGNYGLFAWLAVALHLFLLADADIGRLQGDIHRLSPVVARLFGRLTARLRALRPWGMWAPYVFTLKRRHPVAAPALHHGARGVAAMALGLGYLTASWAALLPAVAPWAPPPALEAPLATAEALLGPWHLINTYTAKAAPPAARTEPQLEVMVNNTYKPVYLWHQPGDLWAGPKFVAPHQPRLDVELSAYGRRGTLLPLPHFVARLMEALCDEPQALQRLFATPLPPKPQAVRLSLWHYSFAPWTQSRDTGAYWTREHLEDGPTLVCGHNDGRGR